MPGESRPTASVVVLGADAVLAALPATAVQLTHACLRAGYQTVVPASWGDELLAAEALRQLRERGQEPAIHCACPRVAARLLGVGSDLAPFLVSLVPPPVATACYLRALSGDVPIRITYVGKCPSGSDVSIDAQFAPAEFLATLNDRGIVLRDQPEVFDALLSPDRRRFRSLPGGLPTPELLWTQGGGRTLVELDGDDPAMPTQLAQHLFAHDHVLVDLATTLGCVCSGAVPSLPSRGARAAVMAHEPPRASTPISDGDVRISLALPISPPRSRPPREPSATPPSASPDITAAATPPEPEPASPEARALAEPFEAPLRRRAARTFRPVTGAVPTTTVGEGRLLPRAYIARRRATARAPAPRSHPPQLPNGFALPSSSEPAPDAPGTPDGGAVPPSAEAPTPDVVDTDDDLPPSEFGASPAAAEERTPATPLPDASVSGDGEIAAGDSGDASRSATSAPTAEAVPPAPSTRPPPRPPRRGEPQLTDRRRDLVLLLVIVALVSAAIGIAAGASFRLGSARADRNDSRSSEAAAAVPTADSSQTQSSAGVAALRDSTLADSAVLAPGEAPDSVSEEDPPSDSIAVQPRPARTEAASSPLRDRRVGAARRHPAAIADRPRPGRQPVARRAANDTVAPAPSSTEAPLELDSASAIRHELERRRARLDSLARVVDSLDSARSHAPRVP